MEEIAVWYWRLRRVIRCESGYIRLGFAEYRQEIEASRQEAKQLGITPASNPDMEIMTDHLFLPSREHADKLLRYEAMIAKRLNSAKAELEKLQAQRRSQQEANPRQNEGDIAKQSQ